MKLLDKIRGFLRPEEEAEPAPAPKAPEKLKKTCKKCGKAFTVDPAWGFVPTFCKDCRQQLKKEKDADRSAGSVMMTPIVIDLEWNRSFPGRRPVEDLPNEIIQIGAVLLDDNYMEQDSFQMYVKPVC